MYETLKEKESTQFFAATRQLFNIDETSLKNNPITPDNIHSGPLADIVNAKLASIENGVVSLVGIGGISPEQVLQYASTLSIDLHLYNKASDLSTSFTEMRENLILWLGLAIMILFIILVVKFGLSVALSTTMIVALIMLLSVFLTAQIQGALNLFNILSAILIMSLAVDYVIFFHLNGLKDHNLTAISLSAMSSTLVFGMLIFSATPAISSFGLTTSVGVLLTYLLSILVQRRSNEA